jgi:hypothetical protein
VTRVKTTNSGPVPHHRTVDLDFPDDPDLCGSCPLLRANAIHDMTAALDAAAGTPDVTQPRTLGETMSDDRMTPEATR